MNYEWTVLNSIGDEWEETLVITNSESDEMDPRFKYPKEFFSSFQRQLLDINCFQ